MVDKTLTTIVLVHLAIPFFLFLNLQNRDVQFSLLQSILLSIGGFALAYKLIPSIAAMTSSANMTGRDLNKRDRKALPESLGIATGTVYLICVIIFQVLDCFQKRDDNTTVTLAEYNASLTSICFMLLLGFSDDVLNLRWRYKLFLPMIASLPLLVSYAGGTAVVVPIPFRFIFGSVLELGIIYKIYLLLLAIFCTNSINILAGINGLEVGQSFVIGCAVITHNLIELLISSNPTVLHAHTFSFFLMTPFVATTISLWLFNWFPSKVFVGDTYTYFAGMCFAVAAIMCHFSKTLLLFFIPQILNFLYSTPQLFGLVPCPRHRIPHFNSKTGNMEATPNFTLLNLTLKIFGPMSEKRLCVYLIIFQDICCICAFLIRYYVALYFF
eukprot:TRINITY_DN3869_c0_g1_i1.p1 TRINITY_DN3869_c0_g1~~TRINITY_DN3869_c0_g1_i1.p1  ORF type:complete len:384 (+),score=53.77 TRINITY_DN3869_c0_g1_i1:101-1252(+)